MHACYGIISNVSTAGCVVRTPRVIRVIVALLDPHSKVVSDILGLRKCW
jgi:hypothetical protein